MPRVMRSDRRIARIMASMALINRKMLDELEYRMLSSISDFCVWLISLSISWDNSTSPFKAGTHFSNIVLTACWSCPASIIPTISSATLNHSESALSNSSRRERSPWYDSVSSCIYSVRLAFLSSTSAL